MKHIKRGRGPSFLNGISNIGGALFGVFWTILTIAMGAWFMAPFGLIFIGISVAHAVYNFKNAKSKNRFSEFDVVDSREEADPWDAQYHPQGTQQTDGYCPYCGAGIEGDFVYCPHCGKELP